MSTDELIPDARVALTINIGPYSDIRLRADTPSDLGELLDQVTVELADKVATTQGFFGLLKTVAEGTGGSVDVVSQRTTSGAPHCAHGERKHFAKADWQAFFCPLPKGRSGQCDPIFKNKDNEGDYAWPA